MRQLTLSQYRLYKWKIIEDVLVLERAQISSNLSYIDYEDFEFELISSARKIDFSGLIRLIKHEFSDKFAEFYGSNKFE